MSGERIRVLLALSSPLSAKNLERMLLDSPAIELAGLARTGAQALSLFEAARPQIVCADEALPVLNGWELTREIMRLRPCPVLLLSSTPDGKCRAAALEAGALDCIAHPVPGEEDAFIARLKLLSRVPVIGRRTMLTASGVSTPLAPARDAEPTLVARAPKVPLAARGILAIGASTGGPGALMSLLSALPGNFPVPVVCVQHVSKGFLEGLVSWLDAGTRLRVRLANDGETVSGGTVLFPPEDHHLEVGASGVVHLSSAPPCDGHRPSVSVLFESVARSFGSRATAVLLTGMGADGASGLLSVRKAGGDTFAQDEGSCVVFGMPRVAIELGAAKHVCAPEEIARRLMS